MRQARIEAIYAEDEGQRAAQVAREPDVKQLYAEFLGEPLGPQVARTAAHHVHQQGQSLTARLQNGNGAPPAAGRGATGGLLRQPPGRPRSRRQRGPVQPCYCEGAMSQGDAALILIVDDDYDFLEINRMILERAGYRVVTAAEPKQALARMEHERPDLVITDLMMTSIDSGFYFARTIKEDPRFTGIPVIIATSVTSALGLDFRPRSDAERAQMYVDAYFDKPLEAKKLLATIAGLLGESAAAPAPAAPRATSPED